MGKSTSCFKIITCGSDSADNDDLEVYESKGSNDKRGWSFRKRSARHRVLSNTVITETTNSGNKESPESATLNFQRPAETTVPEKISVVHCVDEKPPLPTPEYPKGDETVVAAEHESEVDAKLEESVVIIIQTGVRGFLAQRTLLKLTNVVKLQAAVRGHLVRSHAVGTLRCVQAIVKMQALVRARHARLSLEGSHPVKKLGGKPEEDNHSARNLKENLAAKSNVTYVSIEKLLSNKFARQLLDSTPKTKPIHVKCDLSKPDSAWMWLERWMSVSRADVAETTKSVSVKELQEGQKEENFESRLESGIQSEVLFESVELKSTVEESVVPCESEENLITYEAGKFHFQACHSTSSSGKDNLEQPRAENTRTSDVKETSIDTSFLPNQSIQSDADSEMEHKSFSGKLEMETEQPKRSMKRNASEQLETEGKKFIYGARKSSNPAFIAAQSKFEEMISTVNPCGTICSSYQEAGVESEDTISSGAHPIIRTKEISEAENPALHGSRVHVGDSECGTELSISSTLDSPDISDTGAVDYDHEAKISEEICNPNSMKNLDVEAKDVPTIPVSSSSPPVSDQPEKLNIFNGESIDSVVVVDSQQIEKKPENNISDFQREQHSETGVQAYGSSPEASPRSHMTALESQGTPSSQVSVKPKRNKSDKSGSNQKRGSLSAGKKSPSKTNQDSGARSSVEKLPKDQKNGKRRSSFGSAKPDQSDQEPRDSSGNSSLPHFMQATESARAKLQANSSPRSSPDVQDREIYVKKRHSLPGADGRQGSPHILRSMSQAQQGTKANGFYFMGFRQL
ncbi:hypothetical protein FNV43_RR11930 [Rhamnella rubrinervis]|uniref:DUF4005 domain-containing protein n=1 Tax=Rhamnella rubrinervis TaxID=2594499 RepID=A0A8K0MIC7_9ROSA|nr:hypothetical protein FNV43_RR11930 [Rhamnella rubrinervis]